MKEDEKKTAYMWLAIAVGAVTLLAVVAYTLNFWSWPPSGKTQDWANFATYISGTVGVAAVVATLIAFVITLRQQQRLIDSQEEMLEKQRLQLEKLEEQLRLEYQRVAKEKQILLREERYVSIYLFHHFKILKGFYFAALEASQGGSDVQWYKLVTESPDIYPKMLLVDNSDLFSLIEKLDSEMAVDFVKAVSIAKELANIFKSSVSKIALQADNSFKVKQEMKRFNSDFLGYIEKRCMEGDKSCSNFLDKARSNFDNYREPVDYKSLGLEGK